MYKFLKRLTIWLFVWMVFFSIVNKLKANDSIIIVTGDGNTLNILQDGIDNNIDLTANDFDVGDMEIKQNGNSNSVDLNYYHCRLNHHPNLHRFPIMKYNQYKHHHLFGLL